LRRVDRRCLRTRALRGYDWYLMFGLCQSTLFLRVLLLVKCLGQSNFEMLQLQYLQGQCRIEVD
jgi:hypothetical protein